MTHLDKLIAGFKRFRESHFQNHRALFADLLQQGQAPKTLVIGCCDSRVDPTLIFGCEPGDLFIIRNVANLVPTFETAGNYHGTSAALEFGVRHLQVENIIVLGHCQCGGIRALLEGGVGKPGEADFISSWMKLAGNARNRVLSRMPGEPVEKLARACEQEAILVSLDNLLTFPWILERVVERKLALHGWYFDLGRGELLHHVPDTNRFEPFPS